MSQISHILCPVDFSETSEKALRYAERLAESTGAELVLLHAFDVPASFNAAGQSEPADAAEKKQLEELHVRTPYIEVNRVLHAGPPGEVICWVAQERNCDLIVLGTHGRGGLKHLLFGSVAEYVLRNARCPVLTVRDRPENEPPLKEPMVLPPKAPRYM
jgi:universal stress protein A